MNDVLLLPCRPACLGELAGLLASPGIAMPFFGGVLTPAGVDRYLAAHWSGADTGNRIVAVSGAGGAVIGAASIDDGELSYFVARDHWRRGVATAMLDDLLGRPGAGTAQAHVERDNIASARLLERFGFVFRGLAVVAREPLPRTMLRYVLHGQAPPARRGR